MHDRCAIETLGAQLVLVRFGMGASHGSLSWCKKSFLHVGEWVGSMAIPLSTVLEPPIAESGIDFLMRNYKLLLGQYFQSFEFDSKGLL